MRTLALVFPDLACELAALRRESAVGLMQALSLSDPLVVVVAESTAVITPASRLSGATRGARRFGVCPGQTVRVARTLVRCLDVRHVSCSELRTSLDHAAEVALRFGQVVSVGAPDTIWIQHCRATSLLEEEALLLEATERFRLLGHHVRGAFADGPVFAQALARYAMTPHTVAPAGQTLAAMASLPITCLPLDEDKRRLLLREGIITLSDLQNHPDAWCQEHLGDTWAKVLPFFTGTDTTALEVHHLQPAPEEVLTFTEGSVGGVDSILTSLQAMILRLTARLSGRGELAVRLQARYQPRDEPRPWIHHVTLATPSVHGASWLRELRSFVEHQAVEQPLSSLALTATLLQKNNLMSMESPNKSITPPDSALALLMKELREEVGEHHVGFLSPTRTTTLASRRELACPGTSTQLSLWVEKQLASSMPPTRVFRRPAPWEGGLEKGAFVTVGHAPFQVEAIESVVSPCNSPARCTSGTSFRVRLQSEQGMAEAWVLREPRRSRWVVAGWYV